jgi:RNA polymerase sigma-70 factor (ECF subfamily)
MTQRRVDPARSEFARCSEAFEAEFDYVYRTVLRHGVPRQDAEDTAQAVFLIMWRRWPDFDQSRPLRPWLAGIAVRCAYRQRRPREIPVGVPVANDVAPDPEERLSSKRARALVMAALAALPEKYRAVVVMHELDELSISEMARMDGVSLQTASARVRAARKAFARAIGRLTKTGMFMGDALSPEAALAIERAAPPAPAPLRGRAMARARALLALPAIPRPAPPAAPVRGTHPFRLAPGTFGGALAIVVATVTLLPGGPASVDHAREHGGIPSVAARTSSVSPGQRPALLASTDLSVPERRAPLGPVADFPFDERGSATAHDRSGNSNHCLLHGLDPRSMWIPGVGGGAIRFGGSGWLECPRVDGLARLADEITVAGWIRPRSAWGAQTIVGRQQGSGRADALFFGLVNDQLTVASRSFRKRLDRPFPHRPGQWVHVAFTRRADGTLTLFAGGQPLGQNRGRPMPLGGGAAPLTIGGSVNGPDRSRADELFAGDIGELVIYDRALSASELDALATRAP